MLNIKQLSQEVGIGVDTLRVWERRYGFPRPLRDRRGRRQYPPGQVEELRLVKQLQLEGYRPGVIFKLEPKRRRDLLLKGSVLQRCKEEYLKETPPEWLLNGAAVETSSWLRHQLENLELQSFIHQCAIPLISFMDISWKTGAIGVAREHLLSDQLSIILHQYLHQRLAQNTADGSILKFLCLTLNHERHKLGLLMAACIIADCDMSCTWVQEDLPLTEVAVALEATQTNTVVLSFSSHCASHAAMEQLAALRRMLHKNIHIIAGGSALEGQKNIPGVYISTDLTRLPAALATLTRQHMAKLPPHL